MKDRILTASLQKFVDQFGLGQLDESSAFEHFAGHCIISKHSPENFDPGDVVVAGPGDIAIDAVGVLVSVSQKTPLRAEICDKSGPPRVGFRPRNQPRRRCLAARGERRQEISPEVRLPRMGGFPSFSGSGHGML